MLPPHISLTTGTVSAETCLTPPDQPIRDAILKKHGCTLICDGWDDVQNYHLINLVYGTAASSFFEGTTQLESTAGSMAHFMLEGIP